MLKATDSVSAVMIQRSLFSHLQQAQFVADIWTFVVFLVVSLTDVNIQIYYSPDVNVEM